MNMQATGQGIGIDVVQIPRIERLLEQYGERFTAKVFTADELAYATQKSRGDARALATTLASRWAAKEAAAKALGTGFGAGLYWSNVEVVSEGGAPTIRLVGVADTLANKRFMLSLSHDYPTAVAMVMLLA